MRRQVSRKRKVARGGKARPRKRTVPTRRRLTDPAYPNFEIPVPRFTPRPIKLGDTGNLRGYNYLNRRPGKKSGANWNSAPPGQAGVKGVYKSMRRGKTKYSAHKRQILDALVYGQNPIITSNLKDLTVQPDWVSGQQGVFEYDLANSTPSIEAKYDKMKDALYYNTSVAAPTTDTDVGTLRMNSFPGTYIYNMKNTCTNTVYVELRVYKVKGFHSTTLLSAWAEAQTNDNLVQNHLTGGWPTEENVNSLGARPKFNSPYLNTRYAEVAAARAKWTLEPGQQTKYSFQSPEFIFNQARHNVQVQSTDPDFCPYTYRMVLFCHSEMVNDLGDDDVCPGSGHITMNLEKKERWQALPYVKKYQNIARYAWGSVGLPSNEGNLGTEPVANVVYSEQA